MKTLYSIVSVAILFSGVANAEQPLKAKETVQIQNENKNRFKEMGTDELLEQRGKLHNQQEREQLHNELMNRQQSMTKEQKEKFSRMPEKTSQEWGQQGKGNAYGQGQGMMQGKRQGQNDEGMMQQQGQMGKGMMKGQGGGMGGGKGR